MYTLVRSSAASDGYKGQVRPPADWDDSKPSGGDKPSGGAPVREGEIKNDGVDKPSVGKPGDIPS